MPTLDNAIFARFLAALEKRLSEDGLSLIVATTDSAPEVEAAKAKGLVDIGAEGLIVTGAAHSEAFHDLIARTKIPTIITSYFDASSPLPTIGYDNWAAAQLALSHLIALGHQKVVVVHGPLHNNDRTRSRLAGLRAVPWDGDLVTVETEEISLRGGTLAAEQILAAPHRPDAVLCLSDVVALGVLFGLQARGMTVPDDMSLMGLDDLPSSAAAVPSLITVHLPVSRMGDRAATALAQWIATQDKPAPERLDAHLIARASTARNTSRGG